MEQILISRTLIQFPVQNFFSDVSRLFIASFTIVFCLIDRDLFRPCAHYLAQRLLSARSCNTLCVTYMHSTDSKGAWMFVGNDAACDTSSGEVKLQQSPGKLPSLEACQRSCEAAADCQSITFSSTELCTHFNTTCSKTEHSNGAISLRLSSVSESNSSPEPPRHDGKLGF